MNSDDQAPAPNNSGDAASSAPNAPAGDNSAPATESTAVPPVISDSQQPVIASSVPPSNTDSAASNQTTESQPVPPSTPPESSSAVPPALVTSAAATESTPASPDPITPPLKAETKIVPAVKPYGTERRLLNRGGPPSLAEAPVERGVNIPLAIAAMLFVGLAGWFFFKDLKKMREDKAGRAPLHQIAIEKQKELDDPKNGWYPAAKDPIFGFEENEQGWTYEADSPAAILTSAANKPVPATGEAKQSAALQVASAPKETSRGKALQVPVHFPDPGTVYREASKGIDDPYKLVGIRFVAYDVFLPKECPGFVGCLFFMKDKDGLWFQARTRAALVPGEWTTVMADIRGDSPDVTPLGHLGQWDDNQATKVRMIGLTFYGDKKWDGSIYIDNFRGWMRPQRFVNMVQSLGGPVEGGPTVSPDRLKTLQAMVKGAETYKEEGVQVINLRTDPAVPSDAPSSPPSVRKFETLTLRFELNRQIDNPFDPKKADVTCIVEHKATGKKTEHIGFWYQDYERADRFTEEELKPMGRPEWRVRITPREEGEYSYRLKVKLKNEPPLELPARSFFCMPGDANNKGFIGVSQKDKRFFEYENGDFYYPIGHNVSTPVDIRCWKLVFNQDPPAGRGLPMYMDFFEKMGKNGENMAEVWMASWWLGIEWTSRWRDYYGAGRYSLQHGWKMDYLLELARKNGIYIHVVLDNHGKFSNWCDWEFQDNPYNRNSPGDNGVVNNSEEFFTDPTCRELHRNKLRYIAARWGSDPHVFGWELCSEYDLVGGTSQQVNPSNHPRRYFHKSPVLQAWAREMIAWLRQCDAYGHPITNHYATDTQWVDSKLATEPAGDGKPLFDYVATDVYRRVEKRFTVSALENQQWFNTYLRGEARKPFWITEFGGDFNAAPQDFLIADVHCGIWSTWMTEGCGTPLFWWYDLIDVNNLYTYYKAFSEYSKGEDRRGLNGITTPLTITTGTSGAVMGYCYRWPNGAYAWVYNDAAMRTMPPEAERPTHEGVESVIPELLAGKYQVEYWNCYTGKVEKREVVEIKSGHTLHLQFPNFVNDMAVKVKRADGAAATTVPEVPPVKVKAPKTEAPKVDAPKVDEVPVKPVKPPTPPK